MGGNALKNTYTRRYEKEEFFKLYRLDIKEKLERLINSEPSPEFIKIPFKLIKAFKSKESFGDMDILMNKGYYDISHPEFKKKLKDIFKYNEIYCNGNVWSLDYKEIQIDLIFTKEKDFLTSDLYYAYNDLGNLMGRIANKFGTRYGHYGLKYKLRSKFDRTQIIGEFLLSKDPIKIFDFLGYNYSKFNYGFNTLEEVFEFVINGKYFNKEIFAYENLDHQNRTRNRKRASYASFLDYIENKKFENQFTFKKEGEYFDYVNKFFPEANLEQLRQDARDRDKKHNQFKAKFNGRLIMQKFPDLIGQDLGNFIVFMKKTSQTEDEFEERILKLSDEEVSLFIEQHYEQYRKSN